MTIRGGGHPKQAMVLTPVSRMGPPPRSFAADAHDCIMVRSLSTYRIQVCGARIRARMASSPLIVIPTTTSMPSCSEPSRCGLAGGGACGTIGATANLDGLLRAPASNTYGSGRRNGIPSQTKKLG